MKPRDQEGVLGSTLNVYGVSGLKVAGQCLSLSGLFGFLVLRLRKALPYRPVYCSIKRRNCETPSLSSFSEYLFSWGRTRTQPP